MALSYFAYAIATLAYHLPCVSRWVCDPAMWQQCHSIPWSGRNVRIRSSLKPCDRPRFPITWSDRDIPSKNLWQMLHVAIGLPSLSDLSYFHTADILSTLHMRLHSAKNRTFKKENITWLDRDIPALLQCSRFSFTGKGVIRSVCTSTAGCTDDLLAGTLYGGVPSPEEGLF